MISRGKAYLAMKGDAIADLCLQQAPLYWLSMYFHAEERQMHAVQLYTRLHTRE